MSDLNSASKAFLTALTSIDHSKQSSQASTAHTETVNVVGAGGALTAAYEQLRNAAENTEEHLLLQNAIRRFYKQLLVTHNQEVIESSGSELAVELTLAGYIPNNSLVKAQLDEISKIAVTHYEAYSLLHQKGATSMDKSSVWILDTLSVLAANVINPKPIDAAFVDFAYTYFEKITKKELSSADVSNENEFGASLFAAIHQALLKSDTATIRTGLMARYGMTVENLDQYLEYNLHVDRLLQASLTDKLYRLVDRQGAPLRIVRRMIDDKPDFIKLLPRRDAFLDAFEQQVNSEYSNITERINRAIVRSVIFLAITKFIVGIAIEVPYDYWAHGEILWQPLIINLLFPPLYMIALRLTLTLPGYANTKALSERIDAILYGDKIHLSSSRLGVSRRSGAFSVAYAVSSIIVFTGVIWLLTMLGFSLVHILIFLVFVSTASFLGFRLSRLIRELEVVRSVSNGLTFIRDLIYLPFVVVGRWMSEKYAKVNFVTLILDMLIELPMKSLLRIVRQWSAFIDERKDKI